MKNNIVTIEGRHESYDYTVHVDCPRDPGYKILLHMRMLIE